jgi:hypothetical protein
VNPRDGAIKNIVVTAEGTGLKVSPSQKFVSSLDASGSVELPFSVTPDQESDLTFTISYQAGDYTHTTEVVLPITLGDDKTAAVPIVNNVALTSSGSYYDITGDVTNAGISDAKGLVVTVGSPAQATGKYAEYAVGSLAADDSSSFELTFSCSDLSSVPLVIRWKDSSGNNYATTKSLDLSSSSAGSVSANSASASSSSSSKTSGTQSTSFGGNMGAGGPPGGGSLFGIGGSKGSGISAFYPVIAGGVILVVGIVLWVKRKSVLPKLAKLNLPKLKKP